MKILSVDQACVPLRADLRMAGARCALQTNSEEILASLSRWRAPANGEGEGGHSFEMNVIVDSAARREKEVAPHFRGLHHLVFGSFGADETIVFDLLRRRVSAVVSRDTASDERFWNVRLLPTILGLLGATIGVVPLHCACLDKDGEGLLLAGHSGTGKSTLAVTLSRRGFALVSDGWTYVGRNENGLTAHGISAPVKLLPDAVRYFPELRAFEAANASNGELAFEIDATETFRTEARRESIPRWLMLLERTEGRECEIVPLRSEAAQAFFEGSVERLPVQLTEAAETRASLIESLSRTESWLARCGGPPDVAAEAISRFCERM